MEIEFAIKESSVSPVIWLYYRTSKDTEFEPIVFKHIQPNFGSRDTEVYKLFRTLKGGVARDGYRSLYFKQDCSCMLRVKAFLAAYKYVWENQNMKKIEV